jgi:cell pole-organizing protein PopZ
MRAATRAAGVLLLAAVARPAAGQWVRTAETTWLPAAHNWTFRNRFAAADRLFNAFDYGHAILYERLLTQPGAPAAELEAQAFAFITGELLVRPPRLPLAESAIEPTYARLVPEVKAMFDWAHLLHRQVYDILADDRLDEAGRDAAIRDVLRWYRARSDLAFSTHPKTMALMQEQPYSLAFRERYPKFNGLIWAYHWLQVGLYEPLLLGHTPADRQAGVAAAVARFRQMLTAAPATMPYLMPMTAAVSPAFAARYPELAIVFDNLHSMHDVVSDILASRAVPASRKRAEIVRAARRYRDDTTEVMSVTGWRRMADMMGIENMGGPSVGFLPALPTPTVRRGCVMRHDADGNMVMDEHSGHDTMVDTPRPAAATARDPFC